MHIASLQLATHDPATLGAFYANVLGLPVETTAEGVAVRVGTTEMRWTEAPPEQRPRYHFAFNVPSSEFAAAKAWLSERVPLVTEDGADEFFSENWNAHIVYFTDPAGNIGELIARHTLPEAGAHDGLFDASHLLNVSEIGVATGDVLELVAQLGAQFGLEPYGSPSATFAPVGDEHGLFIVVKRGREWYPSTGVVAESLPLAVRFAQNDTHAIFSGPPYTFDV